MVIIYTKYDITLSESVIGVTLQMKANEIFLYPTSL